MAKVTLMGREWELAPYKLGAMIDAAPYIDAQKQRQSMLEQRAGVVISPGDTGAVLAEKINKMVAASTLTENMQNLADAVRILHVGIAKIDPTITADALIDDVDPTPECMAILMAAVNAVLNNSGMRPGEAKAPAKK